MGSPDPTAGGAFGSLGGSASPGVPEERRRLVDEAREAWKKRLVDMSRRNSLLYFRELKRGTLELTKARPDGLAALLRGEPAKLRDLLPQEDAKQLGLTLLAIQKKAQANLEERGLDTLHAAFGLASWPAQDDGRPPEAPVLLVPIAADLKGYELANFSLKRSGDVQVNPVLVFALKVQWGVRLEPERVIEAVVGDDPEERFDLEPAYAVVSQAAAEVRGFAIHNRCVLGNFAFHKMAIVKDLQEGGETFAAHELVAAVAGDKGARAAIQPPHDPFDPRGLDHLPPDQEFLVLDADSSQQAVVHSVLARRHGVVNGPPGTGKSQTIVNLIAELAAQGRKVLFVAEKRAALDVVLERLRDVGLGHLALDLHGAELSRREVMAQIRQSREIIGEALPPPTAHVHAPFVQHRTRLVKHVDGLHEGRPPTGLSVFQLQGHCLRLEPYGTTRTRWVGRDLQCLAPNTSRVEELLREAAAWPDLFLRQGRSPWAEARLEDGKAVQAALERLGRLLQATLPGIRRGLLAIEQRGGLRLPQNQRELAQLGDLVSTINAFLQRYRPSVLDANLGDVAKALEPAKGPLTYLAALIGDPTFRQTRRWMRDQALGVPPSARVLLADARHADELKRAWATWSYAPPSSHAEAEELRSLTADLARDLKALRNAVVRMPDNSARVDDVEAALKALSESRQSAFTVLQVRVIERALVELGTESFLAEIREASPDPAVWALLFRRAWCASALEQIWSESPELASFHGGAHRHAVEEFKDLDHKRLELAVHRVRRAHAERAVQAINVHKDAAILVSRESEKKSRHLPFRRLVNDAGEILTALRPCWMASPLSVSQLLPLDRQLFDVVLFDEASQVLPEDAMGAVVRARQTVVAGDQHQLPPTTFFASSDDSDSNEAGAETQGFESLLDVMSAFCVPWTLNWHYRSRDEALIAFSNHHIYGDRLVTFPGAGSEEPALAHVYVPQQPGLQGQEDSVGAEVERVVDLVIDHALSRPDESLGVITMGIKHANRIDWALFDRLSKEPEARPFFESSRHERFFVKNLERVQGDERDAIILSVGYGKDPTGRLLYRFGPLLTQGGERRLNVAVTRARRRMTVVSSFTHLDMEPGRSSARGVELLRLYLEFSASGGRKLGGDGGAPEPLNDFEQDVYEALTRRGMPLKPQWGVSKYRIDFAAQHPRRPGQFVLAIECDGASYHSAPTARDRDRLRQEHLEGLGWRFHRIWSTDWFLRKADEVELAWAAYEQAVAMADETLPRDSSGPLCPPNDNGPVVPPKASARGTRPQVPKGQPIQYYAKVQLDQLLEWIASDGKLRTDEGLGDELRTELGFQKKGSNIMAAVAAAIQRYHAKMGH